MKLSDFDFDLPEELIAQKPSPERGESRLLVLDRSRASVEHTTFSRLPDYMSHSPVMVFNDTRVIPAKLPGTMEEDGKSIEILLVKEREPGTWEVLMKGIKKFKPGQRILFGKGELVAEFLQRHEDTALIRFGNTPDLDLRLHCLGKMPLPPYIRRSPRDPEEMDQLDRERYQTVFARQPGAIAAPTAGLHFNGNMMDQISESAEPVFLTLHVGVGTFQPVRSEFIRDHTMEKEYYHIPGKTWNTIVEGKRNNRKIMAVGTTSTRVLESVVFDHVSEGDISGWTDRFIYPGQTFRNTDHLLTNFHLPKSTLYMLVCAFTGQSVIEHAYGEAIREKYKFFSYGDAMLIL